MAEVPLLVAAVKATEADVPAGVMVLMAGIPGGSKSADIIIR